MGFDVAAEAYDRFMGRYSRHLSPQLADFAGVQPGQRAVDVGCGPGALTGELVARLGADAVAAVDPSASFVEAARARHPDVEVHRASAELLPFEDASFDVALAQLVVHFMADPAAGLGEMRRVTRSDGVVAACVWDLGGDRAPLSPFWRVARQLDPGVEDESLRAGAREGDLPRLLRQVGLRDVVAAELQVSIEHESFAEWWEPYTAGVGPAGAYVAGLASEQRDELRERCRAALPDGSFVLTSVAWAARGNV